MVALMQYLAKLNFLCDISPQESPADINVSKACDSSACKNTP